MLDDISLKLLRKTKLNDKEAAVYLAVLQLGKASATEIAQLAGLKRSITYVVLDNLIARHYVSLAPGYSKKVYMATDPNAIASELDTTARDFREMLPYLRSMQRRAGKPHVTYYSGIEGARRAFLQIRRPKEARYAISIHKAAKHIPEEVERWKKAYLDGKARPGGRHLLTDTVEDHQYGQTISQAKQVVRYTRKKQEIEMDMALIDGTVFLTDFEREIQVTVIESKAIYNSLCALFDMAFEASKKGVL